MIKTGKKKEELDIPQILRHDNRLVATTSTSKHRGPTASLHINSAYHSLLRVAAPRIAAPYRPSNIKNVFGVAYCLSLRLFLIIAAFSACSTDCYCSRDNEL
ncbi:unnamed protein product [Onchocerca flexuosa]|uniref:Transmembrane protein n=1 Tax=Onchocerca flexuosa TaxID=387005 RepID=A0A183HP69_9BILA|nr:unnamed protein product [Onchocerca flexuosa]